MQSSVDIEALAKLALVTISSKESKVFVSKIFQSIYLFYSCRYKIRVAMFAELLPKKVRLKFHGNTNCCVMICSGR